ncbi:MAG: 30S ribosomal protein S18 [Dehalococcoidia bacterium]|nr:30S ribosomal protein S18 [Dehalococcoidia bacterium]
MTTRPSGAGGGSGPRRFGPPGAGGPSSGGAGGGPGGVRPRTGRGRRFFPPRRKVCQFCIDHVPSIDYKDGGRLRRYLSERARIEPRRKTGTCAKHQRALAVAIKRARHLGLLPFIGTIQSEFHRERPPRDFGPRNFGPRPPMDQQMQPPIEPPAMTDTAVPAPGAEPAAVGPAPAQG